MLSISSYKHPYVTPLTLSVTNQFHYQSSHCKAEPQSLLTNHNIYYYLAVADNAHCSDHYRKLHVQWHCVL